MNPDLLFFNMFIGQIYYHQTTLVDVNIYFFYCLKVTNRKLSSFFFIIFNDFFFKLKDRINKINFLTKITILKTIGTENTNKER